MCPGSAGRRYSVSLPEKPPIVKGTTYRARRHCKRATRRKRNPRCWLTQVTSTETVVRIFTTLSFHLWQECKLLPWRRPTIPLNPWSGRIRRLRRVGGEFKAALDYTDNSVMEVEVILAQFAQDLARCQTACR